MFKKMFSVIAVLTLALPVIATAQSEETAPTLTVETELCTGVEERMPVGMSDTFPADVGQVCLWSKVIGCPDTTSIKHVWYYRGDEMATVELPVRGSSWRTYSYKTIPAGWTGDWVVKVFDADGNVLKAIPFKVGEKAPEAEMKKEEPTEPAAAEKVVEEPEPMEDSAKTGE